MVEQGLIEKVVVPSKKNKSLKTGARCFRLVTADNTQIAEEGVVIQPNDADNDEKDEGLLGIFP
jgi:hypothetical protein